MWLSKRSRQSTRTFGGSLTTIRCPRNSSVLPRSIRASCRRSCSHSRPWTARFAALRPRVASRSAAGRAEAGTTRRANLRTRLSIALDNLDELGHAGTVVVLVERPLLTSLCDLDPFVRVLEVMRDQLRALRSVPVLNNLLPRGEELFEVGFGVGQQKASDA